MPSGMKPTKVLVISVGHSRVFSDMKSAIAFTGDQESTAYNALRKGTITRNGYMYDYIIEEDE